MNIPCPDIRTLRAWVAEAQNAAQNWRQESWLDCEFYDGTQWDEEDWNQAKAAGIVPITINRIFPTINLLLGHQVFNKQDIVAKGRTKEDTELGQIITEGLKFVMDQCNGDYLVHNAFKDSIIPGVGFLFTGVNNDPRREKVEISYRPWTEVWWDPFADPWLKINHCRYVFHQKWMDMQDLIALFPNKQKDIEENFYILSSDSESSYYDYLYNDEANEIEEERRMQSGREWADARRKRLRPVELWYGHYEPASFAQFADGRVVEIKDNMPGWEAYEIIRRSVAVNNTIVRRVRVATFVGDLLLQDVASPFHFDQYPFVPFIGYLNRYGQPYGVPRQIRDMNTEVNKRRSMALAYLKARRVIAEDDIAGGPYGSSEDALQNIYEEANKLDGFVVVRPGKMDGIQIIEQAQLAPAQVQLMEQSEREISEISGANNERLGLQSNADSGIAIEMRQRQGSMMTAAIFENLRESLHRLGEQVLSLIQGEWTEEKVLRITDRLTGAERFAVLNQPIMTESGAIELKNNISQGRYDLIISDSMASDTVREANLVLLAETMKKSPPEAIPHLWAMAMELSQVPNKEVLMAKIKPLFGMSPEEEDMSPEELKQKAMAEAEQQAQLQSQQTQMALQNAQLENQKIQAEIQKIMAEIGDLSEAQRTKRAEVVGRLEVEKERLRTNQDNVNVNKFRAATDAAAREADLEQREIEDLRDFQENMIEMEEKEKDRKAQAENRLNSEQIRRERVRSKK